VTDMKQSVRERYGASATTLEDAPDGTPPTLGLGDPVAFANLQPGETVLDLGSGPGRDLFAAAAAVGLSGRAIGVDMTPEMLERSRAKAPANASILEGDLERLPIHCGAVDVVISNCVINLVDDKRRALVAYRALRPGGRLAILDTAFETEPPAKVREDAGAWCGCVGGALVADDYAALLSDIGFQHVEVEFQDATRGEDGMQARAVQITATKPGEATPDLRPAVASDRSAIETLLIAADLPLDGLRTEDAIVALEDGRVIGVVALERYGSSAFLRSLVVADSRRSKGLGSSLVIAALEVARWSGATDVHLLAPDTRLFERLGFKSTERNHLDATTPSAELDASCCRDASPMSLDFEDADLPVLGKPSSKQLPTFKDGSCC